MMPGEVSGEHQKALERSEVPELVRAPGRSNWEDSLSRGRGPGWEEPCTVRKAYMQTRIHLLSGVYGCKTDVVGRAVCSCSPLKHLPVVIFPNFCVRSGVKTNMYMKCWAHTWNMCVTTFHMHILNRGWKGGNNEA